MNFTILLQTLLWTWVQYRYRVVADVESPFVKITSSPAFVDKSLLIRDIIQKTAGDIGYCIITCPFGFGKTTNLDMLRRFVEIAVDDKHKRLTVSKRRKTDGYKLFSDTKNLKLAVSHDRKLINEHFGNYAVIYLDFEIADATTYAEIIDKVREKIRQLFERYKWLYDDKYAKTVDAKLLPVKSLFETIYSGNANEDDMAVSLLELAKILHETYSCPVFVLIDNYDVPITTAIRYAANAAKLHQFVAKLAINLMNQTCDIVQYLVMAGTSTMLATSIAAEWFDLNAYTFLAQTKYDNYSGFTSDEMSVLYDKLQIPQEERTAVQRHYDGYRYEKHPPHLYIPLSVTAYLNERAHRSDQTPTFNTYWTGNVSVLTNLLWLKNVFLRDFIEDIVITRRVNFQAFLMNPVKDYKNLEKMFNSTRGFEVFKSISYFAYLYEIGYLTNYVPNYLQPPNIEIQQQFDDYLGKYLTTVLNITDAKFQQIATSIRNIVENFTTTEQMRTELENSLSHDDILAFAYERDTKKSRHLNQKNDLLAILYYAVNVYGRHNFASATASVILKRINERKLRRVAQVVDSADFLITSKDQQNILCLQITFDGNITGIIQPVKNYTLYQEQDQLKYLKFLALNMKDRAIQVEPGPAMEMGDREWRELEHLVF